MRILIQQGIVRGTTQVRYGSHSHWHAASNFLRLKPFLKSTNSYVGACEKRLFALGITVAILTLSIVYLLPRYEAARSYPISPIPMSQTLADQEVMVLAKRPSLSKTGIVEFTNKARAENGRLPPLSTNSRLDEIASERADDMLQKQYFGHLSPSGEGAADVAQRNGYQYRYLGENIAMGYFQNDQKLVMSWMQSPGHRKNLLSERCSEIGVAVKRGRMKGEEVWVAVQILGEQSPPVTNDAAALRSLAYASPKSNDSLRKECEPPDESLLNNIVKAKTELSALNKQATSLRNEIVTEQSERASRKDKTALKEDITTYNELVSNINARSQAVRQMISEYNQAVERYNTCIAN